MNIDTAFPSKYLKASDLAGKTVRLKITRIEIEKLGEDLRPVLYFNGTEKALVTNKTNANRITFAYGKETDDWIGKDIEVYPDHVDFQGRLVEAIRVRTPAKGPSQKAATPVTNEPPPASEADYGAIDDSDSIPF